MSHKLRIAAALGLMLLLAGCSGVRISNNALRSDLPETQLMAVEARGFRTADKATVIRAVAETMLEAGFVLDRVDPDGKLWGSAETDVFSFKVAATVTPRGTDTMIVRFVTDKGLGQDIIEVDDPKFYEDKFFKPLAENLHLLASPAT